MSDPTVFDAQSIDSIIRAIRDVWSGHTDFEDGGFDYVAFVIQQDLTDMADDEWDEVECIEELADVCINSLRMLDEQGDAPESLVSQPQCEVIGDFSATADAIQTHVRNVRKGNLDSNACAENLGQACSLAFATMRERGVDPEDEILARLDNHQGKGTTSLVKKYQELYADER